MLKKCLVSMLFLVAASCQSSELKVHSAYDAIWAASAAAPEMVPGIFELTVVETAYLRDATYLNSESDYRDRRNLTIAIDPRILDGLKEKHGTYPDIFFLNRKIRVKGFAQRVRIDFVIDPDDENEVRNKYYYQVHVAVVDVDQIEVVQD
jgi:hypothetical protein